MPSHIRDADNYTHTTNSISLLEYLYVIWSVCECVCVCVYSCDVWAPCCAVDVICVLLDCRVANKWSKKFMFNMLFSSISLSKVKVFLLFAFIRQLVFVYSFHHINTCITTSVNWFRKTCCPVITVYRPTDTTAHKNSIHTKNKVLCIDFLIYEYVCMNGSLVMAKNNCHRWYWNHFSPMCSCRRINNKVKTHCKQHFLNIRSDQIYVKTKFSRIYHTSTKTQTQWTYRQNSTEKNTCTLWEKWQKWTNQREKCAWQIYLGLGGL